MDTSPLVVTLDWRGQSLCGNGLPVLFRVPSLGLRQHQAGLSPPVMTCRSLLPSNVGDLPPCWGKSSPQWFQELGTKLL